MARAQTGEVDLEHLFETDQTAWMEAMAELAGARRMEDLDLVNLHDFLSDMAKRDQREVLSRLTVLLAHLLKWEYQPTL